MFPTGSFDRMVNDLYLREYRKGTDISITVGILVADFRRQFCKENIFNQLERLDKRSGPLIDFYIPGYCITTEVDELYADTYNFKNKTYSFSTKLFNDFVDALERRKINITGRAQLILVTYTDGHLMFDDPMMFDLEQDEKNGTIESTKLFLDFIFEIAGRTIRFDSFKKEIYRDRTKNTVIAYIKENLPSVLLSFLIPSSNK